MYLLLPYFGDKLLGNITWPEKYINGVVFDNIEDVETFANRLEQKYIWYILKQ